MKSQPFKLLWIVLALFILSSCSSTDPFKKGIKTSSISLAFTFVKGFANPDKERVIKQVYEYFSDKMQESIPYSVFYNVLMENLPDQKMRKRRMDIIPWEKHDLSDGTVLVYLVKKYDYRRLRQKFSRYDILRLRLGRENEDWVVLVSEPESFKGLDCIESGRIAELNDESLIDLKNKIKEDAGKLQFNIDLSSQKSNEEVLAGKCLESGELLYDQEKYRDALMQFQKALSITPLNEKAKVYILRCQKAITMGMEK